MAFSDPAPKPSQAELDFEGHNWNQARETFKSRHKDNDKRQSFLQSQTNGSSVKDTCIKLQNESDTKYRKSLGGILDKIDALMNLGDIAIKSAPESVGLAWMGVRMCLHAVQGDFATFQLFSGACADIVGIMISCRVYGKMFGHREGPDDFQELHSKVVDYIPGIYADILDFSYAVRKYADKHLVIRIGKNIFMDQKVQFQSMIDGIQGHETKMRDFANIATDRWLVHYQKEGLKNQTVVMTDIRFMKEALDLNLKTNEAFVRHIEVLEEERKDMRRKAPEEKALDEYEENCRLLDPANDQSDILQDNLLKFREPGTCQWIFGLEEYKQWHDSSQSSMLWVSGGGGYGKSILMSTVVESLKCEFESPSDTIVQYFFCKNGNDATQSTTRVLQTFIYQLYANAGTSVCGLEGANEVVRSALGRKTGEQTTVQKRTINYEAAIVGLLKAMKRNVFLILDAVDECVDREEKRLIETLRKCVTMTSETKLRIMIASRPEADIGNSLQEIPAVKCEGHNESDIRTAVTTEMKKFPGWTASERAYACDEIVRKAGGQFKYVSIALNFLRKPLVRPFSRALDKLPDGLVGSYITSWDNTDPEYLDLLKTALTWTILTEGAISVSEVMDAYSRTYSADAGIQEDREDPEGQQENAELHAQQLRIAGGNFLEVSSSHNIGLRHTTVRDFFTAREQKELPVPNGDSLANISSGSDVQNQRSTEPTSKWFVSEKEGHLAILKVLVQNLVSPVFQREHMSWNDTSDIFLTDTGAVDGEETDKMHKNGGANGDVPEERHDIEQIEVDHDVPVPHTNGDTNDEDDKKHDDSTTLVETGEGVDNSDNSDHDNDDGEDDGEDDEDQDDGDDEDDEDDADVDSKHGEAGGGGNEDDKNADAEYGGDHGEGKQDNYNNDFDHDAWSDNVWSDDEEYVDQQAIVKRSKNQQDQDATNTKRKYRYEVTHWQYHLFKAEQLWSEDERESHADWIEILDTLSTFMCSSSPAYKAYYTLMSRDEASYLYTGEIDTVYTPLQVAAGYGLVSLAKLLIKKGHDTNERTTLHTDGWHQTALELCMDSESDPDLKMARLLLESGADPNADWDGATAFHWTCITEPRADCIQLFLDHGAKMNVQDYWGANIMHYFAEGASTAEHLTMLIEAGGDVNNVNWCGETPLHWLVDRDDDIPIDLLEAFLEAGAKVNVDDNRSQRPLFGVAEKGNLRAVELMIQHGADVHDDNVRGLTALHAAALAGSTEVVKLLIAKGAEVNRPDKIGRTPFYFACQSGREETAQYLLGLLQELPIDEINKADTKGRTPFRKAAARGSLNILKLLLPMIDAGKAINAADSTTGQTAVHRAAYNGEKEALEILMGAGADMLMADREGRTPLQLCALGWAETGNESHEDALMFLIETDKATAARSTDALSTAVVKGSTRLVKKLLEVGADPRMKDEHGWTPLVLAEQYGQQKIIDLLNRRPTIVSQGPTAWSSSAKHIKISENGLQIREVSKAHALTSIVSDHPIPAGVAGYYFELTLEEIPPTSDDDSNEPIVTIGLVTMPTRLVGSLPGLRGWNWCSNSGFAVHMDNDGFLYGGGPFHKGDIIGCAVDFLSKTVFYTKNGQRQREAFANVFGRLFPAVGTALNVAVRANFGADLANTPFQWEGWREWLRGREKEGRRMRRAQKRMDGGYPSDCGSATTDAADD